MNQLKTIFLVLSFFLLGVVAFAQSNPLEKKVSVSAQKEPLAKVLASITKQTGTRFSYNSRLVDPKTNVSVQAQNKTVKEILAAILPASISYKKVGIYIVFFQEKTEKTESRTQKAENQPSDTKQNTEIEKKSFSDNGKRKDSCLYSISTKNSNSVHTEIEKMTANTTTEFISTVAMDTTLPFAEDRQNLSVEQEDTDDFQEESVAKTSKIIQLAFVYPLGTGWVQSAENTYYVSINVLGGSKGQTSTFAPVQAAGIWNFAQQSTCQIAGIVNITKKGKFQIGLINVRDTADGLSLGLINIVKQGGVMEAGIETDEFVHTAIALRTGVKRLYTKVSVGYNYLENFWTVESGLGTSIKLAKNLNINFELTYETLNNDIFGWYSLTQFSPVLNYRFAKHFKIYVGPSLNLYVQNDYFKHSDSHRLINIPNNFLNQNFNYIWAGIVGDIQFRKKSYLY